MSSPKTNDVIHVSCPCGVKLRAPIRLAGTVAKCPKCKTSVMVPDVAADDGADSSLVPEEKCVKCKCTLEPGAVFCVECGTHQDI